MYLYLQDDERLDRTVIGEFLGEPDDMNKTVMYMYVDLLDFKDKDLVQVNYRRISIFMKKKSILQF